MQYFLLGLQQEVLFLKDISEVWHFYLAVVLVSTGEGFFWPLTNLAVSFSHLCPLHSKRLVMRLHTAGWRKIYCDFL